MLIIYATDIVYFFELYAFIIEKIRYLVGNFVKNSVSRSFLS